MEKLLKILQKLSLIFLIGGFILVLLSPVLLILELDNFAFILMKISITIMILGYSCLLSYKP